MSKYLFLYWTPKTEEERRPSPEEMQQIFAQWSAWKEKYRAQVTDLGDGLKPGGKILKKNGEVVDGPLPEVKEIVGGYSVIEAKSFDEALAVARECPIFLMPDATTEIREMMGY